MSDMNIITATRRAAQGASAADIARGEIGGGFYESDIRHSRGSHGSDARGGAGGYSTMEWQ